MCVSRWETSLKFGFLGQMLHKRGTLDAMANGNVVRLELGGTQRRVGKERKRCRRTQIERTMLATQWYTTERHERSVLGAEAGGVVTAGPADKRAGAHERLPGTQGRLLLHRGEEKERCVDSPIRR